MKKMLLFYLFCKIVSSNLLAQEVGWDENKIQENIIKLKTSSETFKERNISILTSPLFWVIDIINIGSYYTSFIVMDLEGQYEINDDFDISLTTSFIINFWANDTTDYQVIFKPMIIYKPFKSMLKGFYLGLYSNIGWWQSYVNQVITQIGTGFSTGYKWVFKNGFTIQLGTGIGVIGYTWNIPNYSIPNTLILLNLLDLRVGYSF